LIHDLREWPDGKPIEADICIVGGGVAGISIASQFMGSGSRVCLLEAGGMQPEADSQQLYEVANEGHIAVAGEDTRLRMFGGSSNQWTGRCAPLDAADFAPRSWVPHSGWPISRQDLDAYYRRAHVVCDLGDFAYGAETLRALGTPAHRLDMEKLEPQLWQMSAPTRFGTKYGPALRATKNVDVVLHSNAMGVRLDPSGTSADHIEVVTPEGKRHRVKARFFVLACGGIENPRLLLMSDDIQKHGVGNQRDIVGRFFMQHLRTDATLVMEGDPYLVSRIYGQHDTASGQFIVGMRLGDRYQAAQKVLNGSAYTSREGSGNPDSGANSGSRVARAFAQGKVPENLGQELLNVVTDFSDLAINLRQRFLRPGAEPYSRGIRQLVLESEQAPNPASRIRLSAERDVLGARRAIADWRVTPLDLASCQELIFTVAAEMARLYKARISVPHWLHSGRDNWAGHLRDVAHHMGTTRMSASEADGVVDKNCCVFGVPNLYIAGSSVFPTGGQANPTLTIVALALRLADHLQAKIA
jgi:choline dehydrogenase-like flavoprotein